MLVAANVEIAQVVGEPEEHTQLFQPHILDQIFDAVVSREIDVLIVAGDVYDKASPAEPAVKLDSDFIERVCLPSQRCSDNANLMPLCLTVPYRNNELCVPSVCGFDVDPITCL